MDLDDKIEQAASAWERVESARWIPLELFTDIVHEHPKGTPQRRECIRRIGSRTGSGESVVRLWVRTIETVPPDLRHPMLPISTCYWVASNLAPEEARQWLERCHDEGLSLRQLQEMLGYEEAARRNPAALSLRRLLRQIARDVEDRPLSPDSAEALTEALSAAIARLPGETG